MHTVDLEDAQTRLAELIDRAVAGEDVIVSRDGKPAVRIQPVDPHRPPVVFGRLAGKFDVPDDFDAALPDSVIAEFEGR